MQERCKNLCNTLVAFLFWVSEQYDYGIHRSTISTRVIGVECSGGNRKLVDLRRVASLIPWTRRCIRSCDSWCRPARQSFLKLNPKPQSLYFFTSKLPSIQCHIYQLDSCTHFLHPFPCKVASDVQVESNYLRSPHSLARFTGSPPAILVALPWPGAPEKRCCPRTTT